MYTLRATHCVVCALYLFYASCCMMCSVLCCAICIVFWIALCISLLCACFVVNHIAKINHNVNKRGGLQSTTSVKIPIVSL